MKLQVFAMATMAVADAYIRAWALDSESVCVARSANIVDTACVVVPEPPFKRCALSAQLPARLAIRAMQTHLCGEHADAGSPGVRRPVAAPRAAPAPVCWL